MDRPYRAALRVSALAPLVILSIAGCASVDLRAGFSEVGAVVQERAGATVVWSQGPELDREAEEKVQALLRGRLTVDDAVQIALLNNRELQALYAELGVAQADLVRAGLFKNPILEAAVLFPLSRVRPDLQLTMVFGFLDAFYVPLRKRVAAAAFEESKLRVTGAVLDFAARVRAAFYAHQADEHTLELRQTIVDALSASFEVSRRLYEAGNITDLDFARSRAEAEASKLALRSAEAASRQSREGLNELMGVWGAATEWTLERRLPEVSGKSLALHEAEGLALARSIDLAHARQRIAVAGEQLGYDRATALIQTGELGVEAEREEGWKVGPVLIVPIPLFDQGQARVGRAAAEFRRAQQEYYALAVRIRATARVVEERVRAARDRALYYRDIVLPLQERIVNEAQLQYNAMQVGVFQLLRDRERQIEIGAAYVDTLREYWLAWTDLALLSSGRLPASAGARVGGSTGRIKTKETANGD
jgi:cobalt-zinc-cadmium efflux system outer membrane protein